MNFKKALVAAAMCLMLVLPAIGVWAYDKVPQKFGEFNQEYTDLSTTHPEILVIGNGIGIYFDTATSKWVTAMGTFGMGGSGTVFKVGNTYYILTAAHVVNPDTVTIQETTYSSITCKCIKVTDIIIHVGPGIGAVSASVHWIDIEHDLAILKLNGTWPAAFSTRYELKPTENLYGGDLLQKGDSVAVIVQIRDESGNKTPWYEVRYGKVIDIRPVVPEYNEGILPWFNMWDVTTDVKIYPGDSGSAVFAFKNGEPIIIGVARAAYLDQYGEYMAYFSRTDLIYYMFEAEKNMAK